MAEPKILLVGSPKNTLPGVPTAIELGSERNVLAEAVPTVNAALEKISASGVDAVVCWARQQEELAVLIRLRKSNLSLPILLYTSSSDPDFEALARRLGATRVLRPEQDPASTATGIRQAVLSGELLREMKLGIQRTKAQVEELRLLTQRNLELSRRGRDQLRKRPRLAFVPLLVESDAEFAFRMVKAFQQADVFAPLRVIKSGQEAIDYLSVARTPDLLGRRPLPTIILLDADLPAGGALDLLLWIRSHRDYSRLPVVMFSARAEAAKMDEAYKHGVNSFLVEPANPEDLVTIIHGLKSYWGMMNEPPNSF